MVSPGLVYTWHDNGNLLSDGVRTYTYDHANRLTQVVSGTLTTQHAYNGDGVRISKTIDGLATQYLVDLVASLPVVISDTEAIYVYGVDIIAQQQAQRYYYVHDGLGSARQLTDESGEIAETYPYDPFGVPLSAGTAYNPFRYTGEAWDAEAELLYLRARYYQPATGRFVTRDPWPGDEWQAGTLNAYLYVANNPVNRVDPTGLNGGLPVIWDPPVVEWLHSQMVEQARGPVLALILVYNRGAVPGWDRNLQKAEALRIFASMVRQGRPWDPKTDIRRKYYAYGSHRIEDYWYYYDVWGNIMFGYLGAAGGFTEFELLNGAGVQQIGSDIGYTVKYGELCRLPRPRHGWRYVLNLWSWDHPQDQVTARSGIRLWTLHRTELQPRHIVDAVVEAGDKGEIERRAEPWPWP